VSIVTRESRSFHPAAWLACVILFFSGLHPAMAATAAQINKDARAALERLYADEPGARTLGEKAEGILVFPNIIKAGFGVGGQRGEGVLLKQGKSAGYFESLAASYGLQAGAQKFSYAIFFMSKAVLKEFETSKGYEIGTGPSVVVLDAGAAKDVNTLTAKAGAFAFIFGQKGLMAGVGLQGTKITRINR
jgi:lipid-binding SYLF domain-containing protein